MLPSNQSFLKLLSSVATSATTLGLFTQSIVCLQSNVFNAASKRREIQARQREILAKVVGWI